MSPWPPSTKPVTSSTETPNSCARNSRNRALSSTPAMPTTRCFGRPERCCITHTITSSGLVMTMTNASGQWSRMPAATSAMTPAFLASRSSRLMPGWRGKPAVTITTSAPAIAA